MFLGGHTVTFGKVISVIGRVSIVVFMGFSLQSLNEAYIRKLAHANPEKTMIIHRSLTYFPDVAIYARPCIVEDSRKVLNPSMVGAHLIIMIMVPLCSC